MASEKRRYCRLFCHFFIYLYKTRKKGFLLFKKRIFKTDLLALYTFRNEIKGCTRAFRKHVLLQNIFIWKQTKIILM